MRTCVLIAGGIEMLIWLGLTIWSVRQPHPIDIAGLHFFIIVCTLPGLALGIFNRRLMMAAGLVSATGFVLFAVAMASQISN